MKAACDEVVFPGMKSSIQNPFIEVIFLANLREHSLSVKEEMDMTYL